MNLHRALMLLLPAAMTLPLGCAKDGGAGPEDTSSAQAAITTTAAPKPSVAAATAPKPMRHAHPGLVGMLFHAAGDLTLKDDQKAAVEKLEQQLKADEGTPRTEFKALRTDLVTGVKAGTIDTTKVTADYAAIDKAVQARQDAGAAALNGLYAALDPAERKAVVAAVRTKQAEHEAQQAKREAEGPKPDPTEWQKKRLEHLTTELGLDAGQQAKVTPLLTKNADATPAAMEAHMADMKKHIDAVLTAFEADGFDAKKLEQGPMPAAKVHERMEHEVQFLTQILPILKPDQRDKLAVSLEKPREMHRPGADHGGDMGTWLHDPMESEGPAAPAPEPGGNQ